MNTPTAQLPFTTQTAATTTSTRSHAMSELSLVPNGDNAITMTSLELVDFINGERAPGEAELRHDHFMAKVPKVLGEKDAPNFRGIYLDAYQREKPCYRFPKREACLMAMSYSYDLQARVFDKMTVLEQELATRQAFAIPQTFTEALRLAADLAEGKARAELEVAQKQKLLEVAAPKAEAFDAISASTDTMTITQAAKILSKKRKDLIQRLHAEHWIYPQNGSWLAYDPHIRSGYLVYKEAKYTDDQTGMEKHKPYCHVTPKGLAKMALMLGQTPQPRGMA